MENASKALLMAAEILIGLLVLSLGMYLYISFSTTAKDIEEENTQIQINEYNAQYTSYESKENLTIYDVITVANLAKENNVYYGYTTSSDQTDYNNYIRVELKTKDETYPNFEQKDSNGMNELIKIDKELETIQDEEGNDKKDLPRYSCSVNINPNTLRVNFVKFTYKNRN